MEEQESGPPKPSGEDYRKLKVILRLLEESITAATPKARADVEVRCSAVGLTLQCLKGPWGRYASACIPVRHAEQPGH